MTTTALPRVILFGFFGLSLGFAQLLSLRTIVRSYVARRRTGFFIFVHVTRMALIAGAWVTIARIGGGRGLLAAFAGFLIARPLLLDRIKGA